MTESEYRSAAQLEHAQDRRFGAFAQRFRQNDFRSHVQQRIMRLLQRVHFHEAALGTAAMLGRTGDEDFARDFLLQPVQHARFGHDDDFVCAGDSLQNVTIFSVEQTSSASMRTA